MPPFGFPSRRRFASGARIPIDREATAAIRAQAAEAARRGRRQLIVLVPLLAALLAVFTYRRELFGLDREIRHRHRRGARGHRLGHRARPRACAGARRVAPRGGRRRRARGLGGAAHRAGLHGARLAAHRGAGDRDARARRLLHRDRLRPRRPADVRQRHRRPGAALGAPVHHRRPRALRGLRHGRRGDRRLLRAALRDDARRAGPRARPQQHRAHHVRAAHPRALGGGHAGPAAAGHRPRGRAAAGRGDGHRAVPRQPARRAGGVRRRGGHRAHQGHARGLRPGRRAGPRGAAGRDHRGRRRAAPRPRGLARRRGDRHAVLTAPRPAMHRQGLSPGPRAPAAVNTARLVQHPLESLLGWHARYGDLFTVRLLVFGTGVYVADPAAIRELFTGDQSALRAGEANSPLSPVARRPLRARARRAASTCATAGCCSPPFQGSGVRTPSGDGHPRGRRGRGRPLARRATRFVMRERMRTLTFEVIARVVFGVTEPARIERLRQALGALMDLDADALAARARCGATSGRWSARGDGFAAGSRAPTRCVYEEIALRRAPSRRPRRAHRRPVAAAARSRRGRRAAQTDAELRDELMTMLLAGHETTATGLAFAFDLLLRDAARARAAARRARRGRRRRVPRRGRDGDAAAAAGDRRRASGRSPQPRTIAGCDLPAGIRVYPAILAVHHRADLYPSRARSGRSASSTAQAESYTWLPFGGGIRRCIGAALARGGDGRGAAPARHPVGAAPGPRTGRDPVVLRGITLVPRHGTPVVVEQAAPGRAG